jgi:hypothetical protein
MKMRMATLNGWSRKLCQNERVRSAAINRESETAKYENQPQGLPMRAAINGAH